jgi:outer membrane receptor protein involved in Fe transport
VAAYVEDTVKVTHWLTVMAGVRQTHFSGASSRMPPVREWALTVLLPPLGWMLRGFYGQFYQAPPLTTLSGPLLAFAQNNNLSFLPLRGERDNEYQFGITIPLKAGRSTPIISGPRPPTSSITTTLATRMSSCLSPSTVR